MAWLLKCFLGWSFNRWYKLLLCNWLMSSCSTKKPPRWTNRLRVPITHSFFQFSTYIRKSFYWSQIRFHLENMTTMSMDWNHFCSTITNRGNQCANHRPWVFSYELLSKHIFGFTVYLVNQWMNIIHVQL